MAVVLMRRPTIHLYLNKKTPNKKAKFQSGRRDGRTRKAQSLSLQRWVWIGKKQCISCLEYDGLDSIKAFARGRCMLYVVSLLVWNWHTRDQTGRTRLLHSGSYSLFQHCYVSICMISLDVLSELEIERFEKIIVSEQSLNMPSASLTSRPFLPFSFSFPIFFFLCRSLQNETLTSLPLPNYLFLPATIIFSVPTRCNGRPPDWGYNPDKYLNLYMLGGKFPIIIKPETLINVAFCL